MAESTWPALEALLKRVSGRTAAISMQASLRDDLDLDSFRLMELAVSVHETFGVDLGQLANQGEPFVTVADLAKHLGAIV